MLQAFQCKVCRNVKHFQTNGNVLFMEQCAIPSSDEAMRRAVAVGSRVGNLGGGFGSVGIVALRIAAGRAGEVQRDGVASLYLCRRQGVDPSRFNA